MTPTPCCLSTTLLRWPSPVMPTAQSAAWSSALCRLCWCSALPTVRMRSQPVQCPEFSLQHSKQHKFSSQGAAICILNCSAVDTYPSVSNPCADITSRTGLTDFTLNLAFGLDPSAEVSSYNYISEYQNDPNGMAGEFYKVSNDQLSLGAGLLCKVGPMSSSMLSSAIGSFSCTVILHATIAPHVIHKVQESTKVENIVTIGTTLMANTSDSYASFAVLMYQSFGRKVKPQLLSVCSVLLQTSCSIGQPCTALHVAC